MKTTMQTGTTKEAGQQVTSNSPSPFLHTLRANLEVFGTSFVMFPRDLQVPLTVTIQLFP